MITYKNHGDYYIFSHKPNTRVYLGNANPDDYVWDEEQQAKRSRSSHYVNKHTGETRKGVNADPDFHKKWEYKCDYEFTRRLHMGCWGNFSKDIHVEYPSKDKAMERLAVSFFFNQTLEEYDAQQAEWAAKREADKREYPMLHNLMMVDGRTFYVNDDGKEITVDEHIELMKAGGYL